MKELNRRSVLTGAVAASAAGALTPLATAPAFAAAPPVGKQAAGYYRYKVGTTEVTVVTDGVNRFKFPDTFRRQQKPRRGERRLDRAVPGEGHDDRDR